jgi:hypothetical protein
METMTTQSLPQDMPRKPKTFKLDERLIKVLDQAAERVGQTPGSLVEGLLWRYCQTMGLLDLSAEPSRDTRGGKREGAGRKPRNPSESEPAPPVPDPSAAGGEVAGGAGDAD